MSIQILNQVSDKEIAKEYKKRFFLKSGDKLSGSDDAAKHLTVLLSNNPSIEQFAVIFLNAANCIITSKIMFKGSLTITRQNKLERLDSIRLFHCTIVLDFYPKNLSQNKRSNLSVPNITIFRISIDRQGLVDEILKIICNLLHK